MTQIGLEAYNPDKITVITISQFNSIKPAIADIITTNESAYQNYIDTNPNINISTMSTYTIKLV